MANEKRLIYLSTYGIYNTNTVNMNPIILLKTPPYPLLYKHSYIILHLLLQLSAVPSLADLCSRSFLTALPFFYVQNTDVTVGSWRRAEILGLLDDILSSVMRISPTILRYP
jgi:hypothetical protein